MKTQEYELIERYMLDCMSDSAHDKDHIYRVLYIALNIAEYEKDVDHNVLIAVCLLHVKAIFHQKIMSLNRTNGCMA